jgi:hypothetical protein
MNPIEEKFYESATLKTKSCVLYSPDVAINFIRELKVNNMWLLGIDGFFIHELNENHEKSILQPSMEDSIDFTTENGMKLNDNPYDYAIKFITDRLSKKLYYEIVSE